LAAEPSATLPPDFLKGLRQLEQVYATSADPLRQPGFSGGADLLDMCCANGYSLECLCNWGKARRLRITPHGIDQGAY